MNIMNRMRLLNLIPPTAVKDNAAFVSNVIDKQADIPTDARGIFCIGVIGVTDIAMAVFNFTESAVKTDAVTLGGTPVIVKDSTTKPTATDDGLLVGIYVPMAKWTQRYGQLLATAGDGSAGTFFAAVGIIDGPGEAAATALALGLKYLDIA